MNNVYQANVTRSACLNCDTVYHGDELYCANCGCILGHTLTGTKQTNLLNAASTETGVQHRTVNLEWGTSYFHPRARLSLYHVDQQRVIPVPVTDLPIILGRNIENMPGIFDLSQCGAEEYGVSRQHIKVSRLRDFLQVEDLNSSNGTFLNKTHLLPGVAYTLRNRAVLQLGHMVLKVHFL